MIVVVVVTVVVMARRMMTIPVIARPVAASVPVAVAMPADHDRRAAVVHGCRLIDDRRRGRRRRCINRCRRDVDRRGNADVDTNTETAGYCGTRRTQRENPDQKWNKTSGLHRSPFGRMCCWRKYSARRRCAYFKFVITDA